MYLSLQQVNNEAWKPAALTTCFLHTCEELVEMCVSELCVSR